MRIFLIMTRDILFVVERNIIGAILGGWDGLLSALVLFMVVEYLTQILIAVLNKKMSDEIGSGGIAKKVAVFSLVAMGNVIDILIFQNESIFRTVIISFYLSNEGLTILKNVEILGLPIPQILKDILEQLKDGKK